MEIQFIQDDDIEQVLKIYSYYVLNTAITFETEIPTLEDFRGRVLKVKSTGHPYIVCKVDGKVVGYAYAVQFGERQAYSWSVISSIYMDIDYKGKGAGTALYKELLEQLKKQNIYSVFALISSTNQESISFHEKLNFKKNATLENIGYKLGEWHSTVYYQCILKIPEGKPLPRVPKFN
ncbi:MAG: hypothetical protein ATN36_08330 [Epulopiscium sp. Nele67-Bin005]|nr:MAG: hypothetical protein ATN36_08330 [Epulopiscium sp. Nele67-Bin005]